jgi:hypothetical protein
MLQLYSDFAAVCPPSLLHPRRCPNAGPPGSRAKHYPVQTIEDPFEQDDWKNWAEITKRMGKDVQIVGGARRRPPAAACACLCVRSADTPRHAPQTICSSPTPPASRRRSRISSATPCFWWAAACRPSTAPVLTARFALLSRRSTRLAASPRALVRTHARGRVLAPVLTRRVRGE